MVYVCIRCKYKTDHIKYINQHFSKKNICQSNYFILMSLEEQNELSRISILNQENTFINTINNFELVLSKGPKNIYNFIEIYKNIIKEENKDINDKLSNFKIPNKKYSIIKNKCFMCEECGFRFENKSNLNKHIRENRCFMVKLINNLKNINFNYNDFNDFNNYLSLKENDYDKFKELNKSFKDYLIYLIFNTNELFYINNLDDDIIIELNNNLFKKYELKELFNKWILKKKYNIDELFNKVNKDYEWKELKRLNERIEYEYKNLMNSDLESYNNIQNLWKIEIYKKNNLFKFYVFENINLIENFKIF